MVVTCAGKDGGEGGGKVILRFYGVLVTYGTFVIKESLSRLNFFSKRMLININYCLSETVGAGEPGLKDQVRKQFKSESFYSLKIHYSYKVLYRLVVAKVVVSSSQSRL